MKKDYNAKMIRLENIDCFNNIIKEVALVNKINESTIIEELVYEKYLPKHADARYWCENYLYRDEDGILETLRKTFLTLALGVKDKARYNNTFKLVRYSADLCINHDGQYNATEWKLKDVMKSFSSVLFWLSVGVNEKTITKNALDAAEELYNAYSKEPEFINLHNLYAVLIKNWEALKDYSATYRMLAAMIDIHPKFVARPGEKRELCDIMIEMSEEWIYKDNIAQESIYKSENYAIRRISNGVVKYSEDQKFIEFDSPENSKHVTAVSVYGGSKYGIPNFIVISEKHNQDFTPDEIEKLYKKCIEICPTFELAVKCQNLPTEERPTIGLFSIGEQYDIDYDVVQFVKTK